MMVASSRNILSRILCKDGTYFSHAGRMLGVVFIASLHCAPSAADCQPYLAMSSEGALQIARPSNYVDICVDRSKKCLALIAGFPPSVETLAYFVSPKELQKDPADHRRPGYSRYYIAQLSQQLHSIDFSAIRRAIRDKNGDLYDSTQLPKSLAQMRRFPLGVLDEDDSSISIGVLMRVEGDGLGQETESATTIAINSIVVVGKNVFSLYFYDDYLGESSIQRARRLTKDWVACFHTGR